jgi:prepilin signal peptidase PulO-like enzyme (type II secretory pathway)
MAVIVALLGLAIGSFLNVVIGRLRSGETGWRGRSQCPHCHAVLRPSELVPLVSFVVLRGRCRSCRKPISWQYPAVEFSTSALFLVAFGLHGGTAGMLGGDFAPFVRDAVFLSVLTVIFVVDLLDMVVHDSVTLPAIVLAAAFNIALGRDPLNLLLAALAGGGFFLFQYLVSRGTWIGGGDIRIGAMMGAMLGFPGVAAALFLSYVCGAAVALGLLAARRAAWSSQLAFGTFLSVGTVLVLFFGERLWGWYAALL